MTKPTLENAWRANTQIQSEQIAKLEAAKERITALEG
jgi:hypothetical protein